jgi:DNA-binding transcriptional LysR family regulator
VELQQLRYFVMVARERNITRAAELLHMAQPPLSRQMQRLEEEFGVALLLRKPRPLQLTDAGRLLYEQATQILTRIEQVKTSARKVGKLERSVLSIGFVPSALYSDLPLIVRRIRRHCPDLDIQLLEMTSMQQTEALRSGRIDIAFGRVRTPDPGIERIVLREERLVAAIPMASPLAKRRGPLPVRSIGGQSLVLYPKYPRPSFADQVLSILDDHGVQPQELHEVQSLQTALGLVAAELGVCIIPASTRSIRSDLRYRVLDDEYALSPIILSNRVNDQSRYVRQVRQLIAVMYPQTLAQCE